LLFILNIRKKFRNRHSANSIFNWSECRIHALIKRGPILAAIHLYTNGVWLCKIFNERDTLALLAETPLRDCSLQVFYANPFLHPLNRIGEIRIDRNNTIELTARDPLIGLQ
jgi:hypothetical protein